MDIKALSAEYESRLPTLEQFNKKLVALLQDLLRANAIEYHAIEGRSKSLRSFLDKVNRPGKTYDDPISQITDQVGIRAILYYPDDVDAVAKFLRNEFSVDELLSVDKTSELQVDQFGYASVHLICQLSNTRHTLSEWKAYQRITFELQVRTVLQHAWASISHALQYKQETDAPKMARRRLNRLAGLLELADAEFSSLRDERKRTQVHSSEQIRIDNLDVPVDSISLTEYLKSSRAVSDLVKHAKKAGLKIERGIDPTQIGTVCTELQINTLTELEAAVNAFLPRAGTFYLAFSKIATKGMHSVMGDAGHWTAVALVGANSRRFSLKELGRIGLWSPQYRREVLAAATKSAATADA